MRWIRRLSSSLSLKLHGRSDLHLLRKICHMVVGATAAALLHAGFDQVVVAAIAGGVYFLFLGVEIARLRICALNDLVIRLTGRIMRECEATQISAVPYFAAGCLVAMAIFPRPVAILSILYLTFGDPAASLAGGLYGDLSIRFSNGKSLIGTLAAAAVCTAISFAFLSSLSLPVHALLALTLLGGIAGGTAEYLPLKVDDNFSIPVISGLVMWLGFTLLGY